MNWAALALAVLQIMVSIIEWSKRRGAMAQAQQEVAAAQGARLLEMTEQGQRLRNRLAAMNDEEQLRLWNEMIRGTEHPPST